MRIPASSSIRSRLTLWYVCVLAILLLVYAAIVFVFQYATLTSQLFHDEVQDIVTVEGLLYFDTHGTLQLRQDYYSRPQSHLLLDRMMEVRTQSGRVLYRSNTLHGFPLGGTNKPNEGDTGFNERVIRLEDGRHVFVVSHIHQMDGQTLLIRLGYSLVPLRDRMEKFLLLLLIALPVAIALAAFAGHAIARRALRPLEEMTARAQGITADNLSDRLTITNPDDELGHMASVFNHLLERLDQAFHQLQRFTADAAHELRTPLASLRAVGEVALEKNGDTESYREALSSILEETSRLNETVNSLLLLARAEVIHSNSGADVFSLAELVNEVLALLGVLTDERHIDVIQENLNAGRVMVKGDRSLMRVAILNVLHNALKFSPVRGQLKVRYQPLGIGQKTISLTVEDQGPGIATGEHEKIFERFFRGHNQPEHTNLGTGLGLSMARLIIERAGGTIYFDENLLHGSRCVIRLARIDL